VRELILIGLKNHHSTTTSHVHFVMKMAKTSRKSEVNASMVAPEKVMVTQSNFRHPSLLSKKKIKI
jgi:hypothetical protein